MRCNTITEAITCRAPGGLIPKRKTSPCHRVLDPHSRACPTQGPSAAATGQARENTVSCRLRNPRMGSQTGRDGAAPSHPPNLRPAPTRVGSLPRPGQRHPSEPGSASLQPEARPQPRARPVSAPPTARSPGSPGGSGGLEESDRSKPGVWKYTDTTPSWRLPLSPFSTPSPSQDYGLESRRGRETQWMFCRVPKFQTCLHQTHNFLKLDVLTFTRSRSSSILSFSFLFHFPFLTGSLLR